MELENFKKMIGDISHWQSSIPPMCPNQAEYDIFERLINKRTPVCLLGQTKVLIPLSNYAVDLNPFSNEIFTIQKDWREMTETAKVIIGDGILNLLGLNFVEKVMKLCDTFICRVFLDKFPWMKYATIFPKEFPNSDIIIKTQENIVIVAWNN